MLQYTCMTCGLNPDINRAGWTVYMSQLMHKTCAATGSRQPVINYDNEEHCEHHHLHSIYISCVFHLHFMCIFASETLLIAYSCASYRNIPMPHSLGGLCTILHWNAYGTYKFRYLHVESMDCGHFSFHISKENVDQQMFHWYASAASQQRVLVILIRGNPQCSLAKNYKYVFSIAIHNKDLLSDESHSVEVPWY